MRTIQFWAIAPISLLATLSSNPLMAAPVWQSHQIVSNSNSPLISLEFYQRQSIVSPVANQILAQASAQPSPSPSESADSESSPSPSPSLPSSPSPSPTTLILEKNGELSKTNSSVLEVDGSLFDKYSFEGTQGKTVTITLESRNFDTYLALFDEQGKLLGEADDMAETCDYKDEKSKKEQLDKGLCNSMLTITLPASGNYQVIVNGRDKIDTGKYTLTIKSN
jgi:Bacterial pre-peptidase C-terminal domain